MLENCHIEREHITFWTQEKVYNQKIKTLYGAKITCNLRQQPLSQQPDTVQFNPLPIDKRTDTIQEYYPVTIHLFIHYFTLVVFLRNSSICWEHKSKTFPKIWQKNKTSVSYSEQSKTQVTVFSPAFLNIYIPRCSLLSSAYWAHEQRI